MKNLNAGGKPAGISVLPHERLSNSVGESMGLQFAKW